MRRLFNNIYSFATLMLLMVCAIGALAPVGNTLAAKKKNKESAKLPMQQRLEKIAAKVPGENPILPIMMHAVERMLNGTPSEGEIDKAVRVAFARHPRVTREMMRQAVANYKAMPEALKRKLIPAELRNLPAVQKFDIKMLAFFTFFSRLFRPKYGSVADLFEDGLKIKLAFLWHKLPF